MPKSASETPSEADIALARAALLEITPAETVGAPAGSIAENDGVVTIYFDTTMPGYVGWKWTVSLSHIKGLSASVLETELTPAEGALLAPDWVPWSDRLAEYKEAQAELAAHALEHANDDDDDDDDDDDEHDDDDDFDDDDVSDDLDGVDIDSLDESAAIHDAQLQEPAVQEPAVQKSAPRRSASSKVRVDESKKAKNEPDDTSPEPPVKARRNQRTKKDQQGDKGE